MPMDGTRLKTALAADILTQIKAKFPKPAGLQSAEATAFDAAQKNMADAIANAAGPDVVTEVKLATVAVTSVSGVVAGGGVSGPGAGTVT